MVGGAIRLPAGRREHRPHRRAVPRPLQRRLRQVGPGQVFRRVAPAHPHAADGRPAGQRQPQPFRVRLQRRRLAAVHGQRQHLGVGGERQVQVGVGLVAQPVDRLVQPAPAGRRRPRVLRQEDFDGRGRRRRVGRRQIQPPFRRCYFPYGAATLGAIVRPPAAGPGRPAPPPATRPDAASAVNSGPATAAQRSTCAAPGTLTSGIAAAPAASAGCSPYSTDAQPAGNARVLFQRPHPVVGAARGARAGEPSPAPPGGPRRPSCGRGCSAPARRPAPADIPPRRRRPVGGRASRPPCRREPRPARRWTRQAPP